MSETLDQLMRQTIDGQYALERQNRCWFLASDRQIIMRAVDRNSFAFSLDYPDNEKPQPLAFFSAAPPQGIAKMCDAIIACRYKQRCYLFMVEVKTAHKDEYKAQLNNGKLFCDWMLQMYKMHGHLDAKPVFVSLLIWHPRPSPTKQGTAHRTDTWLIEKNTKNFNHGFEIQNQSLIPIFDVFEKITQNQPCLKRKPQRKLASK